MKEARNVIISVLVLLFILVGVGVAISRIADKEKTQKVVKTDSQRGFLERIFLGTTPTPTPKKSGLVIVSERGMTPTPTQTMTPSVTPNRPVPTTIPSTGPETAVLVYSLVGLSTGLLLKKRE